MLNLNRLAASTTVAIFSAISAIPFLSTVSVASPNNFNNREHINLDNHKTTSFKIAQSVGCDYLDYYPFFSLTGKWRGDNGAITYVRQIDDQLWWYDEDTNNPPAYSTVLYGTISATIDGCQIDANWANVPKGGLLEYNGTVTFIENSGKLYRVNSTGGFGGNVWTRL